eukprot:gb/GECH01000334.1/.p1 GENE.gb/GECH01000334.1/~~gb/GECH01000334.1/.p1  ORF type:complete len:300 (+),score=78.61 gb/GECH01000334.1/:1-900(+)
MLFILITFILGIVAFTFYMEKRYPVSIRRKLTMATWNRSTEPNIYGRLVVNMEKALDHAAQLSKESGIKVTITSLVAKALARAIDSNRNLNGRIVAGYFLPFPTLDVSVLVDIDDGKDLGKLKIHNADQLSVIEIAKQIDDLANKVRKGKDQDFEKTKQSIRMTPTWLLKPIVFLTGLLSQGLGLNIGAFGIRPFPFGSGVITNIGSFNVDEGYAPPTPFIRAPVLLCTGKVKENVVVDHSAPNDMAIRKQMVMTATIDHRFVDGVVLARMSQVLVDSLEHPELLDQEMDRDKKSKKME